MTIDAAAQSWRAPTERIIGEYATGLPGPCVVVLAGLHGNEPGGVVAVERVLATLRDGELPLRGRFLGVAGNLPALAENKRYIERDLNRNWFERDVEALLARNPAEDTVEDRQQRELIALLDALPHDDDHPVVFLDLHSTSADGLPFSCMPDTLANLKIALEIPVPAVLGLEETIDGPLMAFLSDRGYPGVIIEGGAHHDARTTNVLESSTWLFLAGVGSLDKKDIPDYAAQRELVAELTRGLPRVLEILYRHYTQPNDGFAMTPGYQHYDHVHKDQVLGQDDAGEVRARKSGYLIMPSYHRTSDNGFFLAKHVSWPFVKLLFLLRRIRLDKVCHLLPGATRDSDDPNILHVAKWVPDYFVSVIRLFGWRRRGSTLRESILRRIWVTLPKRLR